MSVVTSAAGASSGDDLDDLMASESTRAARRERKRWQKKKDFARGRRRRRDRRASSSSSSSIRPGHEDEDESDEGPWVPALDLSGNKVRVLPVAWPRLPRTARRAARAVRRAPRPPQLRRVNERRTFEGIGSTSQMAKAQAARRALARMREWVPGLRVSPGCIPLGWFTWAEDNLWRGVPPWEVLATLARKGFRPALCGAFMEMVEAVCSLRCAAGLRDGPSALEGLGRVHTGAMK